MANLGKLIHRTRDDQGEVHVYEHIRFRFLTFGNEVEQSCIDLKQPVRLAHVYTQAMMLAPLLRPASHKALLLGVGGGSLVRALHAADDALHITGIEHRVAVLDAARACFQLPDDERFRVECADAGAFLQRDGQLFDLVFADLYGAEGMHPEQTEAGFLAQCFAHLSADGVLIINQWASEFGSNHDALANLTEVFEGRLLELHVEGGNIVTFAFRGGLPKLQREAWLSSAEALGKRLSIPLERHARNLWRQNAEILGVARFRNGPAR